MNKKIVMGTGIAVLVIVIAIVGVKTIAGDKTTEVPGEEHMESALHIQESNVATNATVLSTESGAAESRESRP